MERDEVIMNGDLVKIWKEVSVNC